MSRFFVRTTLNNGKRMKFVNTTKSDTFGNKEAHKENFGQVSKETIDTLLTPAEKQAATEVENKGVEDVLERTSHSKKPR